MLMLIRTLRMSNIIIELSVSQMFNDFKLEQLRPLTISTANVATGKPERHVWVLFFARIPFVVNRALSATPAENLQQHPPFYTNHTDRMFFV